MPNPFHGGCRITLAVLALILATVAPTSAGKWDGGCPRAKLKLYRNSSEGYSNTLYAHVGHEVTFHLRERVVERGLGFSIEPDGTTVEMTFTPLEGERIPLPPFTVTAVSPTTLRFVIPDTRPILGRLVVGPAEFVIKSGARVVMATRKYPLVLPPMNDIHALTVQGGEVDLYGTLDHTGHRMWIPFSFASFGQGDPMPSCPTAMLTPVTAFAVDFTLRQRDGEFIPHAGYDNLEKTTLYFGDYDLWGVNLYGAKFQRLGKLQRLRDGGLALCALNDTFDLVMRIRLHNAAGGPHSKIIPVQRDGSPYPMKLRNISAEVIDDLWQLPADTLGQICSTVGP